MEYRKNPTREYKEFAEIIHKWYADNKSQTIQEEFLRAINVWKS